MTRQHYRYLVSKPSGKTGARRWYWQPSAELARAGWRMLRLCPGQALVGSAPPPQVLAAWREQDAALQRWEQAGEASRPVAGPPTLGTAIALYKAKDLGWRNLAEKTRKDYAWALRIVDEWAGARPVAQITRKDVQDFYRRLYDQSHSKANAVLRVLRIVLGFAWTEGLTAENAAARQQIVELPPRVRIFLETETAAILAAAEELALPSIGRAQLCGIYLGQRQGDLLALRHNQRSPDGHAVRLALRQSKRGAQVALREHPRLTAALGRPLPHDGPLLVCESTGTRWFASHFRSAYARVRDLAARACPSVADATFMDTRDTAVTKLAEAGATIPEICAVTGHGEASAVTVLKHYLALNGTMADNAIAKLIAREEA